MIGFGNEETLEHRFFLYDGNIENSISWAVMNSSSAGVPSSVARIARLMAGMI
ncbi:hypothetical protein D3C83_171980 [compost metagenome]